MVTIIFLNLNIITRRYGSIYDDIIPKINKASIILEEEDTPVQTVALRLGFDDPCYFSRLFRNKTGVAPSKWRKFVYRE
jgi:YesN/AraC family two-component response regulator